MKIRGCYIFACILTIVLSSCTLEHKEEHVQQISGYDREAPLQNLKDLIASFSCVQLQRTRESAISNIDKLEMIDSIIVVSADNRLLAFDTNGKFLHAFGDKVHLPYEYTTLTSFYRDMDNNIVVVDADSGRLVTYDLSGRYLVTQKVNPKLLTDVQDVCQINRNTIFASMYVHGSSNALFEVIDLTHGFVEDRAHSTIKAGETRLQIGYHPFSKLGNAIRWICPCSKRIDGYNVDCSLLINSSKREPRKEALQPIDDLSVAIYHPLMQNQLFVGFTDIFETKDYLVLSCLDMEYTIINKRTWKCARYVYPQNGTYETLPIVGVRASTEDYLVGILYPLDLEQLRVDDITDDGIRKILDLRQHFDKNGNPILLLYGI